jgi:hypothetical protein
MKKPFPQSTAQPEPDVVMPSPTFPLHMPKVDDGMVSEEEIEREVRRAELADDILISPELLNDYRHVLDGPSVKSPIDPERIKSLYGANTAIPTSFLYVERKPARIYQFPGRPSPGDLKRIERKQLSVFGLDGGKFVRFLPNGTTEPVQTHEDASHA